MTVHQPVAIAVPGKAQARFYTDAAAVTPAGAARFAQAVEALYGLRMSHVIADVFPRTMRGTLEDEAARAWARGTRLRACTADGSVHLVVGRMSRRGDAGPVHYGSTMLLYPAGDGRAVGAFVALLDAQDALFAVAERDPRPRAPAIELEIAPGWTLRECLGDIAWLGAHAAAQAVVPPGAREPLGSGCLLRATS